MLAAARMALKETLDSRGIRIPERVDALIVVSAHEHHNAVLYEKIDQFDIGWVQILVFVNNKVSDSQEAICRQRTGFDVIDTLPNRLAREQARIGLRRPGVEGLELSFFSWSDRLLWR